MVKRIKEHLQRPWLLQFLRKQLGLLFLLTLMGLYYIWNAYRTQKKALLVQRLKQALYEQKTLYLTYSAAISKEKRLSRIQRRVRLLGLKSLQKPPYRLKVALPPHAK